ncbi:MAG: NUDIX domain-containing protein [Burkholderiales bacterium]|nr:NUDIX domain-containing protein [Burkholderiales bacterium]
MKEIVPLPAATVTLVRDGASGVEVLMMQRNFQSGFMPGMYLFPGGALDEADASAEICGLCSGLDDATASGILGVPRGGLAYWVAAIRESFEEAGVLLTYDRSGALVTLSRAEAAARFSERRSALNAGACEFCALLREEGLRLATDRLVYFSHWITPVTAPRRYDTRFFLAAAPENQDPLHDNQETIGHLWVNPGAALDRHRSGQFNMRTPTIRTLEEFADYASVGSLMQALRARRNIPALLPRIGRDGRRLMPGDAGYEEAAAAEAQGTWKI